MVPVRLLELRSRLTNLTRVVIFNGRPPRNLFDDNCNEAKKDNWLIVEGIEPVMELPMRFKEVSAENSPMLVGIVPCR